MSYIRHIYHGRLCFVCNVLHVTFFICSLEVLVLVVPLAVARYGMAISHLFESTFATRPTQPGHPSVRGHNEYW